MRVPSAVVATGIANIRLFGAVGDGLTDDTAAIQAACSAGCSAVYVPQGNYRITQTITINFSANRRLFIQGAGGTIVQAGAGPAFRITGHHQTSADPRQIVPDQYEREVRPYIDGLDIVGDHPEADGICLEGTFKAVLSHTLVRRCRYGLHLVKRNRNVVIEGCHFYDNRLIGIFLDEVNMHQINIVGCHISYNKAGGLKVAGGEVRNLQVTGNDIEYNHQAGGSDIWLVAGPKAIREGAITGNTIQALKGTDGANIRIDGYSPDNPNKVGHLSIASNHIANQAGSNIHIKDSRGITITGNTIKGAARQIVAEHVLALIVSDNCLDDNPDYGQGSVGGILLRGCQQCTVQGLVATTPRGGTKAAGGTIEVHDSAAVNITGCNLDGPLHRGIWLENVHDSRVSDCIILRRTTDSPMRAAIVEAGSSDCNLITGNRTHGGLEGAIIIVGKSTVCSGNLVN